MGIQKLLRPKGRARGQPKRHGTCDALIMPKRKKRPAALVSQKALGEALQSLRCKPRSEKTLRRLQEHIGAFAQQLVNSTVEVRKLAFLKETRKGRKKPIVLSRSKRKKVSSDDVRAYLIESGKTFCLIDTPKRIEPLHKNVLSVRKRTSVPTHEESSAKIINSFFLV